MVICKVKRADPNRDSVDLSLVNVSADELGGTKKRMKQKKSSTALPYYKNEVIIGRVSKLMEGQGVLVQVCRDLIVHTFLLLTNLCVADWRA